MAVLVDGARTPIGRRGGALSACHPADLLGRVVRGLLARTGLAAAEVDQVIAGCVTQAGEQAGNIARTAWLFAGLPSSVACYTVDCQCGSAQQALHLLAAQVDAGVIDLGVACGVESMSRVPLRSNMGGETGMPRPAAWSVDLPNQYEAAERIARHRGLSRTDLDSFGLASQQRAQAAWSAGHYSREIVAVEGFSRDEGLRSTSMAALSALRPVVDNGAHTAGTASQISDGAAAVLVASEDRARALGLPVRARIRAQVVTGAETHYHLDGPIQATERVLKRAGMALADIDLVEVNEAFAAVPLSWLRVYGEEHADHLNVNGGAIALGHPVGSTGARLVTSALHELERRDAATALVTMCAGGALATATVLERV